MKKLFLVCVIAIAAGGYALTEMNVEPERTEVSVPITLDQLQG